MMSVNGQTAAASKKPFNSEGKPVFDSESEIMKLLGTDDIRELEITATLSDVSDIGAWFSYNFMLSISTDDEFGDETINKLTIMAEDFAEKYIDGDYDEPDECEMILESSVSLKTDEIKAFK